MSLQDQLTKSTVNRYPTFEFNKNGILKQKKWHSEDELFYLSEKVLEWFYNDEFGVIIVHGQQGYGKSTYACTSCAEVYGHDMENHRFWYNWDAVKKHLVWTPNDFLTLTEKMKQGHPPYEDKEPMVIWDDAGFYLNAMDYRKRFCVDFAKFLELARTRWGALIFTVSDQRNLLNKVRGIPHAWSIPIQKFDTPTRNNPKYKWRHDKRFARLHKSWCSEDLKKSGKKGQQGDIFYARMPPNFYGWYKDWRKNLFVEGLRDVRSTAREEGL